MADINYLAILVTGAGAFVLSGIWYGALGTRLATLHGAYRQPARSPAVTAAVELPRNLAVATATAWLLSTGTPGPGAALRVGLLLWVAFPVVLLAGSVFHERVPAALAAVHAGDWLVKLSMMAVILSVWR